MIIQNFKNRCLVFSLGSLFIVGRIGDDHIKIFEVNGFILTVAYF